MKVSSDKIALFTVIEHSEQNIGAGDAWREWDKTNPTSEPLEEEAIKCFTSWRKNAGWLKDIDIYCICPSKKYPKKSTISAINTLNVTYIEHYFSETETFDCGYMNVPITGRWFEETYKDKYDHIIHIDLDMTVINPIPIYYFDYPVIIGALDGIKPWTLIHESKINFNLESCFMISRTDRELYRLWCEEIEILKKYSTIKPEYKAELEEFALDSLYFNMFKSWDWKALTHQYQIGERYPIRVKMNPIRVLFHHNHLYESQDVFKEYMKILLKSNF